MTEPTYSVDLIGPAEAEAILRRIHGGPGTSPTKTIALAGGMELVGEFSLQAKDAGSGEVEWEHVQKNLITDFGRRSWMDSHWASAYVSFSPSIELPLVSRYSTSTDVSQCVSSIVSPTNNSITHTKSFSATYGVPGSNRTLGMIALGFQNLNSVVANVGLCYFMSYALLTPPKTQTTTQTLEVVYKVSMNPIA